MNQNLETAIRNEILTRIPMNMLEPEDSHGLLALDLRLLLSRFYNWKNRRVSIRPRNVHISRELKAKNRPEVNVLAGKIEKGVDLTPHLSRRIDAVFTANPSRQELTSRKDLDLLLNEWAIYHLHISDVLEGDGFVKRGKDLLMAAFRRDDAYLIDLLDHDAWTKENLVKIAVTDWPDAHLFIVMPGMRLTLPVLEGDRGQLRAAGLTTPVQLPSGLAFGMGMSRAGTSSWIEGQINKLWNSIALDEMRNVPESEILDKVRNALAWYPFSE